MDQQWFSGMTVDRLVGNLSFRRSAEGRQSKHFRPRKKALYTDKDEECDQALLQQTALEKHMSRKDPNQTAARTLGRGDKTRRPLITLDVRVLSGKEPETGNDPHAEKGTQTQ
jgi:hypothetical protein